MQGIRTGNDVGALIQTAQARGYTYGPSTGLHQPYRIDHAARTIYLDGALDLYAYYAALAAALADLAGDPGSDNLVVLRRSS